jgi:hypothetical protein
MLKKTLVALCATTALLSAGAALADKPGAGWITIEKAIEVAKTKAGYVEVYAAEADDNGYCMKRASTALPAISCVTRKTDRPAGSLLRLPHPVPCRVD